MATITGSHQVASFTAPINGTSPIDANSVRNNDNALRSAYVNHDADTGIHVQSSTLAARPSASIAGRKWITVDGADAKLWIDTGTAWVQVGSIAAGSIVNSDISPSAGIVDTKLATIATAGKVSNSATTATSSNTNNAIVARDGSGNFSAGTITANLTGNVTGNVTGSSGSTTGNAATATALSSARTFALTGDVTGSVSSDLTSGASISTTIAAGAIVNADVNANAAIDYSKLASLPSGNIIVGSSGNVPTARAVTGDVTINNTGVTAIANGVIVNADISASAAIGYSKLASLSSGNVIVGNASNVATSTAVTGDVTISNTGVTAIGSGVIVNADINASAAIDYSKLAALTSGNILVGSSGNVATSVAMSGDVTISNAGVTTIDAAFPKIVKTYLSSSVDLSAGTQVTLFTVSVPSIAAGDIVEVALAYSMLNNSGTNKTLTIKAALGSADSTVNSGVIPTNANLYTHNCILRIAAISSASVVSTGWTATGNAAAAGATGTGTGDFGTYNTFNTDITGTQTLTVSAESSASASNQAIGPVIATVKLIKAV